MLLPIQPRINYFGDGFHGNYSSGSSDVYASTLNGDPIVRRYKNFTINAGHTLTVSNRCKGLFIYVLGDAIINGTLTMTARGCTSVGALISSNNLNKIVLTSALLQDLSIPSVGGAGGLSVTPPVNQRRAGLPGETGINGQSGGGGSGSCIRGGVGGTSGAGSAGTSYSGGTGGGGVSDSGTRYHGVANGGAGGAGASGGNYYTAAGGAGNPGGGGVYGGGTGATGTGGLLVLVVKGTLTVGSSGIISSNGSNGGASANVAAGGASGGGSITVLYGRLVNNGSILSNGGVGGTSGGGNPGGNGGAGSVRIRQVTI